MNSLLNKAFLNAKKENRPALLTYTVAGDNTKKKSLEILKSISDYADICELGFPPPLSRGLFCISRSVGILAHSWEQLNQGGRNKGPMPPNYLPKFEAD